jgi:hypothetical protein
MSLPLIAASAQSLRAVDAPNDLFVATVHAMAIPHQEISNSFLVEELLKSN